MNCPKCGSYHKHLLDTGKTSYNAARRKYKCKNCYAYYSEYTLSAFDWKLYYSRLQNQKNSASILREKNKLIKELREKNDKLRRKLYRLERGFK